MTLGEQIRAARGGLGFTQRYVAKTLSVNPSAVNQWESDTTRPSITKRAQLAVLLRLRIEDLIPEASVEVTRLPDAPDEPCMSMEINRIRELRHAKRLSLDVTAKLAGTTIQQLSRLERGQRRLTVDWMHRIASALGVRPADLLPETGVEVGEFIQSDVELNLVRWWRTMTTADRGWLVARARDYGFKLSNDVAN